MKDMKMIEDMVAKMMMMGKGGMGKNKMEEGEYEEEDYSEDSEEEGYEQDKVTIKFCGKDALKKAHDLLMGSAYSPKK
jgi:SepF-like predicted cell division protein (DUF552 family)